MSQRVVYLLGPEMLELRHVPVPEPGPGEILVRIEAATTCGTDVKVFRRGGHPRMLKVPTPFGHELAGVVAAVGVGVSRWKVGDRVVVGNSAPCHDCDYCHRGRENLCADLQYLNGAFAEMLLVPRRFVDRNTHRIPDGLASEIASLTEPLACVLHGLEACDLIRSSDVVVYGGGPIGLLFVGALRTAGHSVALADPNEGRLQVGRKLGADRSVLILRGGGQAREVRRHAHDPAGFDCAIDATGVSEVWSDAADSVRPGGLVNLFGGCAPGTSISLDTYRIHYSEITLKGVYHHRPRTMARALEMLAAAAFDARSLLTSERPLEELELALRSMIQKEALKVVIRPWH